MAVAVATADDFAVACRVVSRRVVSCRQPPKKLLPTYDSIFFSSISAIV